MAGICIGELDSALCCLALICNDMQVSLRHSDQPWEGHRQLWNPDRRPLIIPATGVVGILLEAGSILK